MNAVKFSTVAIGVGLLVLAFAHWLKLDYFYFAGYTILQYIVLATAWNILGGYCGYVNFGSAAFFAVSNDEAQQKFPGFRTIKPYLRVAKQPKLAGDSE